MVIELKRPDIQPHARHIGQVLEYRDIIQNYRPNLQGIDCYLFGYAKSKGGPYLFTGREGPLKKRMIQNLFGRYTTAAGISGRSVHALRHSIGSGSICCPAPPGA